jgi:DNA-binding Lrp family transcriptional regulator
MVRAFVMATTAAGQSTALLDPIEAIDGVEEAHVVAGQYDLIVEAVGEEVYAVINAAATDIRDLEAVLDTRTYICLE